MKSAKLPDWAVAIAPGKIEMHANKFYPEWLNLLGVEEGAITQYWLECAYQCAKLDVQFAVAGTDLMPVEGSALCLYVKDTDKKYAQANYPAGEGVVKAREHYKRIRQMPGL